MRAVYGILTADGRYLYATYDSPEQSYLFDLKTDANAERNVLTPALKQHYDEEIIEHLQLIADYYGYKPGDRIARGFIEALMLIRCARKVELRIAWSCQPFSHPSPSTILASFSCFPASLRDSRASAFTEAFRSYLRPASR